MLMGLDKRNKALIETSQNKIVITVIKIILKRIHFQIKIIIKSKKAIFIIKKINMIINKNIIIIIIKIQIIVNNKGKMIILIQEMVIIDLIILLEVIIVKMALIRDTIIRTVMLIMEDMFNAIIIMIILVEIMKTMLIQKLIPLKCKNLKRIKGNKVMKIMRVNF